MNGTSQALYETRAHIARIGRLLFERHLTDAAGGNISVRVDDLICLTPRYSGQSRRWQLEPDDVLVVDFEGNVLEGQGQISRESKVHLRLHRDFREAGSAIIHAHARNILVFAAANRPMPPVLEATLKFGEIPVIDFAPSHSAQLAENIAGALRGQEERIRTQAAAVIAPWHGLFLMGRHLDAAFDAVERLDTNAYCLLMGQQLGVSAAQQALVELAAAWKR